MIRAAISRSPATNASPAGRGPAGGRNRSSASARSGRGRSGKGLLSLRLSERLRHRGALFRRGPPVPAEQQPDSGSLGMSSAGEASGNGVSATLKKPSGSIRVTLPSLPGSRYQYRYFVASPKRRENWKRSSILSGRCRYSGARGEYRPGRRRSSRAAALLAPLRPGADDAGALEIQILSGNPGAEHCLNLSPG